MIQCTASHLHQRITSLRPARNLDLKQENELQKLLLTYTRCFRRSGEISEVDLESNILQKASPRHRLCIKTNAFSPTASEIIQKQTYQGVWHIVYQGVWSVLTSIQFVFQTLSNRFCTKMFELISLDFKCLLIETLLSKD